jgi:hypothetical protein
MTRRRATGAALVFAALMLALSLATVGVPGLGGTASAANPGPFPGSRHGVGFQTECVSAGLAGDGFIIMTTYFFGVGPDNQGLRFVIAGIHAVNECDEPFYTRFNFCAPVPQEGGPVVADPVGAVLPGEVLVGRDEVVRLGLDGFFCGGGGPEPFPGEPLDFVLGG